MTNWEMSWLSLFVAGMFEIAWAVGLKYTEGFTRLMPSVFVLVSMALSIVCLAFALHDLPMGTAYAVWTGIGAIGTVVYGILVFNEPSDPLRLACIGLILAGIVGLKFVTE
jgi:quaternary ammonium compound-resistance protein SugE